MSDRRWLGPAAAGIALLCAPAAFITAGDDAAGGLAALVVGVALFFVARLLPTAIAIALVAMCFVLTQPWADHEMFPDVPMAMITLAPALAGAAVRSRDLVARQLDERAAELEAEREIYADLSVRYERARVASELHDIVAHAMSVMVVQASAGQRLAAVDADLTAEAFGAIADSARQAEADMKRLVELLADPDATHSPDFAVIEELVRRAAGGGLDVTLRLEGSRDGVTPDAVAIAYAVVRESLTNALRYAAGAPVVVRIEGRRHELVAEVTNAAATRSAALAGHGTGSGLGGLRERVARADGRFLAGPTDDGGWQVLARVPRGARAAAAHRGA